MQPTLHVAGEGGGGMWPPVTQKLDSPALACESVKHVASAKSMHFLLEHIQ